MTINKAIQLWNSKKRRMGCVNATNWFCKHVKNFKPQRLHSYTKVGEYFSHVVATDGKIIIDLTPHLNSPK